MNIREKILVVEDEKSIAHFISTVLNNNGYGFSETYVGDDVPFVYTTLEKAYK